MAKTDNLSDFLTDVANSIRTKTQTSEQINAQDFSYKILSIQTDGGGTTLKNLLDAKKTCYYLFSGYGGTSAGDFIQPNDTENVVNMNNMFNGCSFLISAPQLNTSNVKTMQEMFHYCTALTTIPLLDTSNVTNMQGMFSDCKSLTTIPQFDTSNVTDMGYMFYGCGELTTIPLLDTSNVTDMRFMFHGCNDLTTVPALDANNVTDTDYTHYLSFMFEGCSNLKSILMTNIGANLNISASTKFEREDLLVILNNLKTVTSTTTLTMGETNLAKLTDEDKAIATGKG